MPGLNDVETRLPSVWQSLFARIIFVVAVLVVIATALPFVPSLTNYRHTLMANKLSVARTAVFALDMDSDGNFDRTLSFGQKTKLLQHIGAHRVEVRGADGRVLVVSETTPPEAKVTYDLDRHTDIGFLIDTFASLFRDNNQVVQLHGLAPNDPSVVVDMVVEQRPMADELISFAKTMLLPLIVVRLLFLAIVVVVLRSLILAPLRRLSVSMIAFRNHPGDPGRVIAASNRKDEIGVAERELAAMQSVLRSTLGQHGRLAALGEAVSKINHDLRGILSTARLVSDRLAASDDPIVKKSLPPLLSALDRAVRLCKRTLDFSASEPVLKRMRFPFKLFIDEVATAVIPAAGTEFVLINDAPPDVFVYADRDQFFRAFSNLISNAIEAKARRFSIAAHRNEDDEFVITVADDGTGIPDEVRANLFQPFAGRSRVGGTGLGLAIVREVIRGHGGTITLTSTGPLGTVFEIVLPPSAVTAAPKVRATRRWGGLRTIDGRIGDGHMGDGQMSDGQKTKGHATERPDR